MGDMCSFSEDFEKKSKSKEWSFCPVPHLCNSSKIEAHPEEENAMRQTIGTRFDSTVIENCYQGLSA